MRSRFWLVGLGLVAFLAAAGPVMAGSNVEASTRDYQVAAGQLGTALNTVAAQSHVQILYATELVADKHSPGLSGAYSVGTALETLLQGTGLRAEPVNDNTWVIRARPQPKPAAAPVPADPPDEPDEPVQLQALQVTGSLIPKARIETASPTIEFSAEQMRREGFHTVYDALRAMPIATGAVQGPQGASTYTTGAQALSLFGLNPGFTLILVDGHPLPDYPLLYDGASNFTDLSSIPMAMVERIDIVPGNQSAVYGSSAIAGVVNIILKKHVEGLHVGLRAGSYTAGGGESQRLELVGGHSWLDDRLSVTYGFQFSNQDPVWAYERDLTKTTASNPTTESAVPIQTFMHARFGADGNQVLVAPPPGACKSVGDLFGGTTRLAQGGNGTYCGTTVAGERTMMNAQRQYVGYATGSFRVNDNTELYATGQYSLAQYRFAPLGGFIWLPNIDGYGMFVDGNTGGLATAWRQLAPEEQDYRESETKQAVHSYQVVAGVRGYFGASDWHYDGYLDRAEQIVKERQLHPLTAEVNHFFREQFLGPKLGVDAATGYPIFKPDWGNFYQALTPADYRSFSDYTQTRSSTSIEHMTVLISNNYLFSLPAGDAGIAFQGQVGHQTWNNPTDPRVVNGDFWGLAGTVGAGKRNSSSLAAEFNLPVTSILSLDTAARYDEYRYAGRSDGKMTWRVGLEFRPVNTLLVRGNYATAFRAPDMGRIFLGPSTNFLGVTDYYLCAQRQPDRPLAECDYRNVNVGGVHSGNPNLKDITAKSTGLGVVWSPSKSFDLHADYLHIKIADEITDLNVDQLMRDDANCLLGSLDAGSPTCVDTLERVKRDKLGNLQQVNSGPINISTEKLGILTAGANYRVDTTHAGRFAANVEYNNVLDHKQRRYPGDPQIDRLADPTRSTEFKTITKASLRWAVADWDFTLLGLRYGKTPNFTAQLAGYSAPGAGDVKPWVLYNLSGAYHVSKDLRVGLSINNLLDEAPPYDATYSRWPYYNTQNYTIYGRAIFLRLDWAFGAN